MELLETCALISWIVIAFVLLYAMIENICGKIKRSIEQKREDKRDLEIKVHMLETELELLKSDKRYKGL